MVDGSPSEIESDLEAGIGESDETLLQWFVQAKPDFILWIGQNPDLQELLLEGVQPFLGSTETHVVQMATWCDFVFKSDLQNQEKARVAAGIASLEVLNATIDKF